jgi:hypothetical protein
MSVEAGEDMGKLLVGFGLVLMATGTAVYGLTGSPTFAASGSEAAREVTLFLSFVAGAVSSMLGGLLGRQR